ncbi:Hypothetical protein, putative [Bodo saltans]|uniref:Uncharacterized protein n=1 Tax=Bodo saltans TaxID=75058 RepID=A0A0S4JMD6_BODSA|nr:Hypothetical protein, putative [Bodo saltans]|eukprot:CUG91372.1 Hypothetical protein, putative [Bodo saltans]
MEEEIADQHRRVEDLVAALDRLLVVPADQQRVRDLISGSPPRQWNEDDASGIHALRFDSSRASRVDGSPSYYRRAVHGKSTVPGEKQKVGGVRHRPIPAEVAVEHAFSSPDCVPMIITTSLPYRPSFYSAQFRADTRESVGNTVLQFDNVIDGSGIASALIGDGTTPRPHAKVGAIDKKEVAASFELLVHQREELRRLMELRDEMRKESSRLMALAQKVRADHAQVQKRADAVTVRERQVRSREQSLDTLTAQWKEEIRRVKHNHANGMRVASSVNRQLHEELSRCTIMAPDEADDRSAHSERNFGGSYA